ncbi:hypothetical protein EON65_01595 [archaeon]|nr:MAG: hypothetical protein EON65_01595 [archaeon]
MISSLSSLILDQRNSVLRPNDSKCCRNGKEADSAMRGVEVRHQILVACGSRAASSIIQS